MAFQTIQGNGRIDFIGTDEVDVLSTFNIGEPMYVGARKANDIVNVFNPLQGVAVAATVQGGEGADTLNIATSYTNSTVNGNKGNDVVTITGVLNASLLAGGSGDDQLGTAGVPISLTSGSTINGNDGNDTINVQALVGGQASIGSSKILGGKDNDTLLIGTVGANVIVTNTSFNGNDGADTVSLGSTGVLSNVTLFGGQGADTIRMTNATSGAGTTATTLSGDIGNDTLADTAGANIANIFLGGDGNDTITAAGGADSVTGGQGADTITTGNGARIIYTSVSDSFAPTSGTSGSIDVVTAGGNNTRINVSALTSTLTGNTPGIAAVNDLGNFTFNATATQTWADVKTAITASAFNGVSGSNGNNRLNGYTITMAGNGVGDLTAGNIYVVLQDTVAGLNNGDWMIQGADAAARTFGNYTV